MRPGLLVKILEHYWGRRWPYFGAVKIRQGPDPLEEEELWQRS